MKTIKVIKSKKPKTKSRIAQTKKPTRQQRQTQNVTVNVSGNVTTEQDLVTSIRNGLLNAQYNGDAITLVAI